MKTILKTGLITIIATLILAPAALAQVELGLDVMSRYVWRGTDFGASPSLQPDISLSIGNLTIGGWAAIATNGNPNGSEIDFYATYSIETSAGTFDLMVTDYTFPDTPTGAYFKSGSHFVELGLGYSGTEKLPLTLFTGVFVTNDDDYSVYSEIGYSISNVDLSVGLTPAASALYGTTGPGIIHTGLSTSRQISTGSGFSFKLTGSVVFNPYANNAYYLVGIGF